LLSNQRNERAKDNRLGRHQPGQLQQRGAELDQPEIANPNRDRGLPVRFVDLE